MDAVKLILEVHALSLCFPDTSLNMIEESGQGRTKPQGTLSWSKAHGLIGEDIFLKAFEEYSGTFTLGFYANLSIASILTIVDVRQGCPFKEKQLIVATQKLSYTLFLMGTSAKHNLADLRKKGQKPVLV